MVKLHEALASMGQPVDSEAAGGEVRWRSWIDGFLCHFFFPECCK